MKFFVVSKEFLEYVSDVDEFGDYLDKCEIPYERDWDKDTITINISPDNMFYILQVLSLYKYPPRKITVCFKNFMLYIEEKK